MPYSRQDLDSYIYAIPACPDTFQGQGIVISAGGSYLASAYVAICSIRTTGCTLPIQLWHIGNNELPQILYPLFEKHGVVCVDSLAALKPLNLKSFGGWQNKAYSIVYSPFAEVLSFDADNIALKDPSHLFTEPSYQNHGQIFWPDFLFESQNQWCIKPEAWTFLGLPPIKGAELESGQLLINKKRCWKALMTALHMNLEADFYYTHCSYGDKDTYRLAWEYLDIPPYVIPTRPTLLEDMVRLQHDPHGQALFQHSRKWVLPASKNPHRTSFLMEQECFSWLSEFESALKDLGVVFS